MTDDELKTIFVDFTSFWWPCEHCGKPVPYPYYFCGECTEKLLGEPPKPLKPYDIRKVENNNDYCKCSLTREKIKNTPELVDFMLDKCLLADSRTKMHKRLEEVCDLAIKALEQQPKYGKWIETDSDDACWYMCSECHRRTDEKSYYCPDCGCRMVDPPEREEN